jgi:hypothetical protein
VIDCVVELICDSDHDTVPYSDCVTDDDIDALRLDLDDDDAELHGDADRERSDETDAERDAIDVDADGERVIESVPDEVCVADTLAVGVDDSESVPVAAGVCDVDAHADVEPDVAELGDVDKEGEMDAVADGELETRGETELDAVVETQAETERDAPDDRVVLLDIVGEGDVDDEKEVEKDAWPDAVKEGLGDALREMVCAVVADEEKDADSDARPDADTEMLGVPDTDRLTADVDESDAVVHRDTEGVPLIESEPDVDGEEEPERDADPDREGVSDVRPDAVLDWLLVTELVALRDRVPDGEKVGEPELDAVTVLVAVADDDAVVVDEMLGKREPLEQDDDERDVVGSALIDGDGVEEGQTDDVADLAGVADNDRAVLGDAAWEADTDTLPVCEIEIDEECVSESKGDAVVMGDVLAVRDVRGELLKSGETVIDDVRKLDTDTATLAVVVLLRVIETSAVSDTVAVIVVVYETEAAPDADDEAVRLDETDRLVDVDGDAEADGEIDVDRVAAIIGDADCAALADPPRFDGEAEVDVVGQRDGESVVESVALTDSEVDAEL